MKTLMAALAALGFAGAAVAQTATPTTPPEVTDTDGNGTYSLVELQVVYPALTEAQFGQIDANGDGAVDPDELTAAQDAGLLVQ